MSNTPPPSFEPSGNVPRRRPVLPGKSGTEPAPPDIAQQMSATPPPSYAPRRPAKAPVTSNSRVTVPGPVTAEQPLAKPRNRKRRKPRTGRIFLITFLVLIIGWPTFLLLWVNGHLTRVDALVSGPHSGGTTYLLAGSDGRDPAEDSGVIGERADSIMLIRRAPGGQSSMVSLPRDLYVEIPGYGWNKINASYSFGGPELLVETVQNLTDLQVDHFMQVNMQGFVPLVDAVGGVELCADIEADEPRSGLSWTPGCHHSDGETALAFARMRYQDPRGDLGRAERQRDVIKAVTKKALSPTTLLNPVDQWKLANAGAQTLTVDEKAGTFDIAKLLLTFRAASSSGLSGVPPLSSISEATDVGSVVLLDEEAAPSFFTKLADGTLTEADFESYF